MTTVLEPTKPRRPVATYYVPSKREWGKKYTVELFADGKDQCTCQATGKCTHITISRYDFQSRQN